MAKRGAADPQKQMKGFGVPDVESISSHEYLETMNEYVKSIGIPDLNQQGLMDLSEQTVRIRKGRETSEKFTALDLTLDPRIVTESLFSVFPVSEETDLRLKEQTNTGQLKDQLRDIMVQSKKDILNGLVQLHGTTLEANHVLIEFRKWIRSKEEQGLHLGISMEERLELAREFALNRSPDRGYEEWVNKQLEGRSDETSVESDPLTRWKKLYIKERSKQDERFGNLTEAEQLKIADEERRREYRGVLFKNAKDNALLKSIILPDLRAATMMSSGRVMQSLMTVLEDYSELQSLLNSTDPEERCWATREIVSLWEDASMEYEDMTYAYLDSKELNPEALARKAKLTGEKAASQANRFSRNWQEAVDPQMMSGLLLLSALSPALGVFVLASIFMPLMLRSMYERSSREIQEESENQLDLFAREKAEVTVQRMTGNCVMTEVSGLLANGVSINEIVKTLPTIAERYEEISRQMLGQVYSLYKEMPPDREFQKGEATYNMLVDRLKEIAAPTVATLHSKGMQALFRNIPLSAEMDMKMADSKTFDTWERVARNAKPPEGGPPHVTLDCKEPEMDNLGESVSKFRRNAKDIETLNAQWAKIYGQLLKEEAEREKVDPDGPLFAKWPSLFDLPSEDYSIKPTPMGSELGDSASTTTIQALTIGDVIGDLKVLVDDFVGDKDKAKAKDMQKETEYIIRQFHTVALDIGMRMIPRNTWDHINRLKQDPGKTEIEKKLKILSALETGLVEASKRTGDGTTFQIVLYLISQLRAERDAHRPSTDKELTGDQSDVLKKEDPAEDKRNDEILKQSPYYIPLDEFDWDLKKEKRKEKGREEKEEKRKRGGNVPPMRVMHFMDSVREGNWDIYGGGYLPKVTSLCEVFNQTSQPEILHNILMEHVSERDLFRGKQTEKIKQAGRQTGEDDSDRDTGDDGPEGRS